MTSILAFSCTHFTFCPFKLCGAREEAFFPSPVADYESSLMCCQQLFYVFVYPHKSFLLSSWQLCKSTHSISLPHSFQVQNLGYIFSNYIIKRFLRVLSQVFHLCQAAHIPGVLSLMRVRTTIVLSRFIHASPYFKNRIYYFS